jgi:hypothetical protein
MGESKVFTNHGENWHDLPSPESQEQEEQRMEEWLEQGRKKGKGIKGAWEQKSLSKNIYCCRDAYIRILH